MGKILKQKKHKKSKQKFRIIAYSGKKCFTCHQEFAQPCFILDDKQDTISIPLWVETKHSTIEDTLECLSQTVQKLSSDINDITISIRSIDKKLWDYDAIHNPGTY